jgi:hypothetical protein
VVAQNGEASTLVGSRLEIGIVSYGRKNKNVTNRDKIEIRGIATSVILVEETRLIN